MDVEFSRQMAPLAFVSVLPKQQMVATDEGISSVCMNGLCHGNILMMFLVKIEQNGLYCCLLFLWNYYTFAFY